MDGTGELGWTPLQVYLSWLFADIQCCSRCSYKGSLDSFPIKKNGTGWTKTCLRCTTSKMASKANKENQNPDPNQGRRSKHLSEMQPSVITLEECLQLVSMNKDSPFELDAFVHIPVGLFGEGDEGEEIVHKRANRIRDELARASEYHWKWVLVRWLRYVQTYIHGHQSKEVSSRECINSCDIFLCTVRRRADEAETPYRYK